MARLAELRKKAKDMGISKSVILAATTASALEKVIADAKSHGKPKAKAKGVKAKAKAKAPTKKATGRKNSARKASAPAKSKGATKAKRQSNSNGDGMGGRNTLNGVDYGNTEGWNARSGSAPDRIIRTLKKARGNRTKAFEALKGDLWDFVAKKKKNGDKRTKQEALDMLKWRISRTAWDFALRTGQHEASSNRVKYGTGGTGQGIFKPAKAQSASKPAAKKATAKAGRKSASAQKATQGRTGAKRGRPKGSKNKAKAGSRR